eukprot:PhF_6_TR10275/c0_g1_i1/m.15925
MSSHKKSDAEKADALRSLFRNSCGVWRGQKSDDTPNPILLSFPTKCVRTVPSEYVMRKLLDHYTNSNDVMIVRYTQEKCTACNAIGKIQEYLCHELSGKYSRLHFYEVQKEKLPEATKHMVRFPQLKGFNHGQWVDIDYKPPQEFRDSIFQQVEHHVHMQRKSGRAVTALEAEEMYFSASAPAISLIMEDSITSFYTKTQVRLHNYWKQVSQRRSWFYKKYILSEVDEASKGAFNQDISLFGETVGQTKDTATTGKEGAGEQNITPAAAT